MSRECGKIRQWARQQTREAISPEVQEHWDGRRSAQAYRATVRLGNSRAGTKRRDIRAFPLAHPTKTEWVSALKQPGRQGGMGAREITHSPREIGEEFEGEEVPDDLPRIPDPLGAYARGR
eukprot:6023358-Pyramimonas_sp.AAC.1